MQMRVVRLLIMAMELYMLMSDQLWVGVMQITGVNFAYKIAFTATPPVGSDSGIALQDHLYPV